MSNNKHHTPVDQAITSAFPGLHRDTGARVTRGVSNAESWDRVVTVVTEIYSTQQAGASKYGTTKRF